MVVRRKINDELYHHGIIGQKWGKKNGPPYPLGSDVSTGKRIKQLTNANKESTRVSKSINEALSNNKGQIQLSDTQKKILIGSIAVVGGLTLAAGAAYVAKKYNMGYNRNIDLKTKLNTIVEEVSIYRYQDGNFYNPNDGNSIYSSFGILDRWEYGAHSLGEVIKGHKNLGESYLYEFKGKNLTVPSIELSRDIFKSNLSDSEISNDLLKTFQLNYNKYTHEIPKLGTRKANTERIKLFDKAIQDLENGKINTESIKNIYDAWNVSITNNNEFDSWATTNKIFDTFRKKGYSAIWDTHDLYISTMKSSNPIIVIDKNALTLESVKRISKIEELLGGARGVVTTGGKNLLKNFENIVIINS